MAQLRQDYAAFQERGVEVVVVGPDSQKIFRQYWDENEMPFVGLGDPGSKVADQFHQEVNLLKFGRMPALFVIDRQGIIRYSHYGSSMSDIPSNQEILKVLDQIKTTAGKEM